MHLRICALFLTAPVALPQAGDKEGEPQPDLPASLAVPPAPALSWEEELATFRVQAPFRVELVAAEPLVNDPVAAEFDEDGRLWVVEMTGYMPDVDGHDEDAPVGSIAVLDDDDGDGRMDRRTVFLAGLVLPRSVHPALGGALVILPGEVQHCRDTDGDGTADERTVVDRFRGGIESPEHALNGFERTLDNVYRCANGGVGYRPVDGSWTKVATTGGGQWGITKDDLGRVFYNTNPHPLRGDLFPSTYGLRNPAHGRIAGLNVLLTPDLTTWPARINPGVNRAYRAETLRDDYTLRVFTAACGPHVLRGGALGEDARGDAFACEPSGNLVKRLHFRPEGSLGLVAGPVPEGAEFWASTDERFRPVNAFGGPDGALYVVDMYRGVIQHRMFVTSFLRRQIVARGLETPLGLGRIWRVTSAQHERAPHPPLGEATWTELVAALSSPDGWVRDTAQRLIVEEWDGDRATLERLRELAVAGESSLGRLHALWTLAGIDGWTRGLLLQAVRDPDPAVACAAARIAEPYLSTGRAAIREAVLERARTTTDARLRHQCLLSLGAIRTDAGDAAIAELVTLDCSSAELRSAALSGLRSRELGFLRLLLEHPGWDEPASGRAKLLELLARAVVRERRAERVEELVALVADGAAWTGPALARGALAGRGTLPTGEPAPIRLAGEPDAVEGLARANLGDLGPTLAEALVWPGKPGVVEAAPVRPLTADEHARFERGREMYAAVCASCHQDSGLGEPGKAPRLRGSPWVLGSEDRLLRILVDGLVGPLEMDGEVWELEMPALGASAEDVAAVATYVRREWGHGADPVEAETVSRLRASSDRHRPWTVEELSSLE